MSGLDLLLQGVIDGLATGSVYMLLALGLSLVFGMMGLINFAYGSLIVWAGYAAWALAAMGLPYPIVLLGAGGATVLLSIAIGRFAFLPFTGAPPATLLLASFGVALALQATATILFGDAPHVVPVPALLTTSLAIGPLRVSVLQLSALVLGAVVLVLLDILVNRTRFGIEMRASAEDATAATLMGVASDRVLLSVFAVTGLIAAVVAFIWFGQAGTVTPRGDFNPTLKAFIAIVLGGLGTVRGAVIGGLALGLIESGLAATLSSDLLAYSQAFAFLLIILVLLVRPQGIAGRILTVSK
jgi:branched-chain amino acid transport system permease protein